MSDSAMIGRWRNRVEMSVRGLEDATYVRRKATQWFRSRYWVGAKGGKRAMEMADVDKQEINWVWAFCRALQSTLWSRNPDTMVLSPWWPQPIRKLMARSVDHVLEEIKYRAHMKMVLQDIGLGGFGVLRVGYNNEMSWSEERQEKEQRGAEDEARALLEGKQVSVSKEQDHDARMGVLTKIRRDWEQQQALTPELAEAIDELIRIHNEQRFENPRPPMVLDNPQGVWVSRLPPLIGDEPAVGWEPEASFEETRWLWQKWVRPLSEVRGNPYYDKKARHMAEATAPRTSKILGVEKGEVKDHIAGASPGEREDMSMVVGCDILDRHTGTMMVICEGLDRWLFRERYPYTDLFKGAGFHVFEIAENPEGGPGLTPVEAAASQIIIGNNVEKVFARTAMKSTPGTICDSEMIGEVDREKIANPEDIGMVIPVKNKVRQKDIGAAFRDLPAPQMSPIIGEASARSQAFISLMLGFSDANLGGGEHSRSATAANVVAQSTTEFLGEFAEKIGDTAAGVHCDVLQLLKAYYGPREMVLLLGPDAEGWPQFQAEDRKMLYLTESVKVDVGSSLPGRREQRMRKASEFAAQMIQMPGTNIPEISKLLCEEYGYSHERFVQPPDQQREMAEQQPETSADHPVGGPDQGAPASADSGGMSQSDIMNQTRQQSAQLAAQARSGGA